MSNQTLDDISKLPSFGNEYDVFGWILVNGYNHDTDLEEELNYTYKNNVKKSKFDIKHYDYWFSDPGCWSDFGTLKDFLTDIILFAKVINSKIKLSTNRAGVKNGIRLEFVGDSTISAYGFFLITKKEHGIGTVRSMLRGGFENLVEID